MAMKTHRTSVPERAKRANRKHRKNRDHHGLPHLIVELSALPEFGGSPCSLTMAYKVCNREAVSARLDAAMKEARRRLRRAKGRVA
jgi:hypothetical protein